jgi:phosphate transport system permease protein
LTASLRSTASRKQINTIFVAFCLATAFLSVVVLIVLLLAIVFQGRHFIGWNFISRPPGPDPSNAGIHPALWGSIWVCLGCAFFALPLGVATAIFLEEFKPRNVVLRGLHSFVQLNIANLSGVPSVVYGIIGLTAFATFFGLFRNAAGKESPWEFGVSYEYQFEAEDRKTVIVVPGRGHNEQFLDIPRDLKVRDSSGNIVPANIIGATDPLPQDRQLLARTFRDDALGSRLARKRWYYVRLPFGRGVLTGSLTLMLVVLPIVIIASQESLRAVPNSLREGALGMGATRWQTVWNVTLPAAVPGIMTGAILSMSRAIGEAAPILMIAGIVYITNTPRNMMDDFTTMPLQIYEWAQRPKEVFHWLAASGIIVLLLVLLVFNAAAVFIRQTYQKPLS